MTRVPPDGELRVELTVHSAFRSTAVQRAATVAAARSNSDAVAKQFVSTVNGEIKDVGEKAKLKLSGEPRDDLVLAGHAADSTFILKRVYALSVSC